MQAVITLINSQLGKLKQLELLEDGHHKKGDKRKKKKGVSQKKTILKSKNCCRNLIEKINTWTVSLEVILYTS